MKITASRNGYGLYVVFQGSTPPTQQLYKIMREDLDKYEMLTFGKLSGAETTFVHEEP